MRWGGNLAAQVAAEFREAQQLRRGPVASEEPAAVVVLVAPVVETVRARARRIVQSRRAS